MTELADSIIGLIKQVESNNPQYISKKDLKKLGKLHQAADAIPKTKFSENKTTSIEKYWDKVREFQQELGKKYDYEWNQIKINKRTGEIVRDIPKDNHKKHIPTCLECGELFVSHNWSAHKRCGHY